MAFSFFIPVLNVTRASITPPQLARIFAIYGLGFVVLFLMFALLYGRAWRKRAALGLTELEAFDTRRSAGEHLVSAGVGVLATLIALLAPWPFPVFSGFSYFLMGPAHWIYGVRTGRRRKSLEARLDGSHQLA